MQPSMIPVACKWRALQEMTRLEASCFALHDCEGLLDAIVEAPGLVGMLTAQPY